MSPLRALAVASVALAALAAASPAFAQFGRFGPGRGYAVDGDDGPYLSQVDPDEISQRLGSGAALGFAAEAGNQGSHHGLRLRMPLTEAAIAAIVQELDGRWPHEPRRPVQVHILASGFYAPMALPDGSIMVPLGLLHQVETDDELAYILGHELAHVRLGHFADDQGFRQQRQTGQRLAQAYSLAAGLYRLRADASGGTLQFGSSDSAAVSRDQSRAAAAAETLNLMVNVFTEPAWARQQEDQADALSFDLAEGAGFNGLDGADAAFGRMQADFDHRRALAESAEGLLNETAGAALDPGNVQAMASGGGEGVVRGLLGGLARSAGRRGLEFASGYFGQRHRTPEARSEGLSNYADEAYPDRSGFIDIQDARLAAIRATSEFEEASRAVGALQEAQDARRNGDLASAQAAVARAQATSFGGSPAIANEAAAIQADLGHIDEADRLYAQAHLDPDDSLDGYVAHVRMLARAGRRDRARQVIAEGAARFGGGELGEKAFLPALVAISFADGREQEGVAYLRRCVAYAEERLSQDCQLAATGSTERYDSLSPEARRQVDDALRDTRSTGPGLDDLGSAVNALGGLFGRGG